MLQLNSNYDILRACAALVPCEQLEPEEQIFVDAVAPIGQQEADVLKEDIRAGRDPLGDAYLAINTPESRRGYGAVYTPADVVEYMVAEGKEIGAPTRIVDAGCGSGRFALACAREFPSAHIVAIDASPFATLMCKAAVYALGLADRVSIVLGDFTTASLPEPRESGSTLWIGNPPYVRHHDISPASKRWFAMTAQGLGLKASGLSGLHAYFLLSIASRMKEGDFGVLVTSAEWLDVKYGSLIRTLLVERLGLRRIKLYDKSQQVFRDADTTAVVFSFDSRLARQPKRTVEVDGEGASLAAKRVELSCLGRSGRWSSVLAGAEDSAAPEGYVRLGDFARVHRGIVTGANKFWVKRPTEEVNEAVSIPVVSHAREIMTGTTTLSATGLSRLIALPPSLDELDESDAEYAKSIIREGEELGVDKGYVAQSRKAWWSIPVGEGATILMTYMARRPPVFVANPERVRSLNVVHGIYPLIDMSEHAVYGLVDYLNSSVSMENGRTYCGGLTKFEPKEVEQLWVPSPEMLEEGTWRS